MKKAIFLAFMQVLAFGLYAQLSKWTYYEDTTATLSSPRAIDLNNDGVDDIVMGAGAEDKAKISIIALDGKTGKLLWNKTAENEVFSSAVFQDVNSDGIPDVFMAGRTGILYCLNGDNGATIWEYFPHNKKDAADSGLYNFFHPQLIPDQNNDGLLDLLIANGGDKSKSYTDTIGRPAGKIMVLSGKTGKKLAEIKTPDKQESYMSPIIYDFKNDGNPLVIFGSGGETMSGALWYISLANLMKNDNSSAKRLVFTGKNGFIPPPVIVDLNEDGFKDLVVNAYNGDLFAFSGADFSKLWSVNFNGFETQCTPAVGNFVGSHHADILTVLFKGKAPSFKDYVQVVIDGETGKIAWTDSLSDLHFASPNAFDYDGDGFDEALFSYNDFGGTSFKHNLVVFDFQTKKETFLVANEEGLNLSSTPLIQDIDNNGMVDIIYSYKKNVKNPIAADGLYIKILPDVAKKYPWGVSWGSYLGTYNNGAYTFESNKCSLANLDVTAKKTHPSCNGYSDGAIELSVFPGTSPFVFNWNDGKTGATRNSMKKGTYYVRTMDNKDCYRIDTFKLNDPYKIEIFGDSTFCVGEESGNARITSSGCVCANSGCTYKWNTGGEDHGLYGVKAGKYTVLLTHADGCKVYDTVYVYDAQPMLDSAIKFNISCYGQNDGFIELFPRDTFEFRAKWLHGPFDLKLDSLKAGTYTVKLRDASWCYDTLEFVINEPDSLEKLVVDYNNINCFGENSGSITLRAIGGTKAYWYHANNLGGTDSIINNLKAGEYWVHVSDTNGCLSDSQKVTLFERPEIKLQLASLPQTDPFEENGKAWVVAQGGLAPYRYKWNDKNKTQNDTLFGVKSNNYQVSVTDSLGCVKQGSVFVDFSTSVKSADNQEFSVFPIPVSNTLSIKSQLGSTISIIDLSGKILLQTTTSQIFETIDCSFLDSGVYLLHCQTNNSLQSLKIIVEK